MSKINLTWYGRCAFLIGIKDIKIMIDPHDQFDGFNMGLVNADYTLISSSWHDHGHIGATPRSIIISEPGVKETEEDENIVFTGIETKESRGTRNVVFNIKTDDFSLTNFADLGDPTSLKNISEKEKKVIESTNILFGRPNQILHEKGVTSIDLALRYCDPKIIIPHHFYPKKLVKRVGAPDKFYTHYKPQVEKLVERLPYKVEMIKEYKKEVEFDSYNEKTVILFNDTHPQLTYKNKHNLFN